MESWARGLLPAAIMLLGTAVCATPAWAGKRPSPTPAAQGSFEDGLSAYDTSRWIKSDGWTNGSPFDNAWRADHATLSGGLLDLMLDDQSTLGAPYASGEYRTTGFYGYGCFEAAFRPVSAPGVVTSLFTFAGPYDNGGNGKHNEIDIEFVGQFASGGKSKVQFNYWTNDDAYASRNEYVHAMDFDASQASHAYGFKWTSGGIVWYVDGKPVYEVLDDPASPTPKATESLQKIMVNLWPADATAAGWAGTFVYAGALHAKYDWIRYTAGEQCAVTGTPPASPPPPTGSATTMRIASIALSLDSRQTQVIARVTVVDGLGNPVSGATVTGSWTGPITGGDTSRVTSTSGLATFYSSRSQATGFETFCVTGVTLSGKSYDSSLNTETCDVIKK